ncbi:MAG: hypothetical protein WD273_01620 [Trueperaceae bacterium]
MLLMEVVVDRENMVAAFKRVLVNAGASGVDDMSVGELKPFLDLEWSGIKEELLAGRFRPSPVWLVEIPKPGGGVRALGIPTVVDRLVQQAVLQVLMSWGARRVGDKRVLRFIRSFLRAGVMMGGLVSARSEGTPQGGPLSPLLSNVLSDDLDGELERR